MNNIYILLTKSSTVPSRLIRRVTGDSYTHCSIAFDKNISKMYSFARLHEHFPLPGGMIEENINRGIFRRQTDAPCTLLAMPVSDDVYYSAKNEVEKMYVCASDYSYNVLGLVTCNMKIQFSRRNHYFCSQFIAEVLESSGAAHTPKPPLLMHPVDFLDMACLTPVFSGSVGELCSITKEQIVKKPAAAV